MGSANPFESVTSGGKGNGLIGLRPGQNVRLSTPHCQQVHPPHPLFLLEQGTPMGGIYACVHTIYPVTRLLWNFNFWQGTAWKAVHLILCKGPSILCNAV
jgi:hypothetical protein